MKLNFLEKILKFDIRPFSAFTFGGRNRRPKAENFRFRPKILASGIPLIDYVVFLLFENMKSWKSLAAIFYIKIEKT